MSVTLVGTGGLYTRLGVFFRGIESANAEISNQYLETGGLASVGRTSLNILAQFASAQQEVIKGLFDARDAMRSSPSQWKSFLAGLAVSTATEMVSDDTSPVATDTTTIVKEIQRQMIGSGTLYNADNDVDASTVTASATARSSNNGTGKLQVSIKRGDGRSGELCFNETIEADCTGDAQGSGTARSETFVVRGEVAVSDPLAWDWPAGSGGSITLTSIDTELDAQTTGNLLTNSDFYDTTVANTPDNWEILVGVAGTDIFSEATTVYRTAMKALKFTGTGGSPLSSIAQEFESVDGSNIELEPNTVYLVNFFARKSASLSAGVISVDLLDGTNTVVSDDAGTANTTTVAHGTLTTSYAAYTATFVTPRVLPTTGLKFRIRVSTALTSGESVYIADLAMAVGTEVYAGGPKVAIFSGATNWLVDDHIDLAVTNDYAGKMQQYMDRVFDLRGKGLQLPSNTASAETILDTLITPRAIGQVVATIDPANLNNATTTSDIIDMSLWQEVTFYLLVGANDSTIDFKLQSDTLVGFGSATDIPGKVITQEVGGNDDNSQWVIHLSREDMPAGEYFARASVTVGNGTTNLGGLVAIGTRPDAGVDAANDLATVLQIID